MPLRDSDRRAFADMLRTVSSVYGRDFSADVVSLYWHALEAFDLAAVRQAFDRHVRNPDTGQFMPKPADLIRMLQGSTVDSAMQAWAVVEWAVRSVGGWDDVSFEDAVSTKCVELLGGWVKLCSATEEEMQFRAREFQALYRGYTMRRELVLPPDRLIGRANAHNAAHALPLQPVLHIGRDPETGRPRLTGARALAIAATEAPVLAAPQT